MSQFFRQSARPRLLVACAAFVAAALAVAPVQPKSFMEHRWNGHGRAGSPRPRCYRHDFNVLGNIGNAGKWFDTAAFAQPTGVRFGNTGRNQFYGPGAWTVDLSVFRSFAMGSTRRLEFRVQGNNIVNHPVFGNPSATTTSGTFGQITGCGQAGGSYIERQFQVGLRFTF